MGEHIYLLGIMKKIYFFELRNVTSSGQIRTWHPWIRIKIDWSDGRAYILTWRIIFSSFVIWTPWVGFEPKNPRIGLKYSEVTREHLHLFDVLKKIDCHELRNLTSLDGFEPGVPRFGLKYLEAIREPAYLLIVERKNIKNNFYKLRNLTCLCRIRTRDP